MTTQQRYAMPVDPNEAIIPGQFDSLMRWEYEDGRASLLKLYEKGKERQWNGNSRIDWSLDLDPENPQELPDEQISIFGSDDLEPADQAGAGQSAAPPAGAAALAVHARRAGGLALRVEDRACRCRAWTPSSTRPPR